MTTPIAKFFLGYIQTSEIKMLLNQSSSWKEENLFKNCDLKEARHQEKDYIGLSIDSPISSEDLKIKEKILKDALQKHCPKLQLDKQKIFIFPQIFLS